MARWTFKQIKPQKARGKLVESMWDDPNWIAEEKYDGDRRIAQFLPAIVRFTGCRESVDGSGFVEKTLNVPHLSGAWPKKADWIEGLPKHIEPPAGLDGTVLDGEMIDSRNFLTRVQSGEGKSKFVASIMGSLPEEAVRKQIERGWLRYVVFDCLFYKGKDVRALPWGERRELAGKAVKEWANPFVTTAVMTVGNKKKYYQDVVATGGEGVVLKHVDHTYGNERLWVKVKREATADVKITRFEKAKAVSVKKYDTEATPTKYDGMIGAVVGSQYHPGKKEWVEVAQVSGMDDATRLDITSNRSKYIGKVLRIKHNGREPTGRFRHPRWDGLRTDKNPKDCIFDLEEK